MISHYYTITKIVQELQLLVGCKLLECSSQEKDEVTLTFFDSEELHHVFYSGLNNFETIFYFKEFNRKRMNSISLFEKIYGDVLQEVRILDNTRVVEFVFINYRIYFLLFGGSKNNIIITNANNKIIDAFSDVKELEGTFVELLEPNFFKLTELPSELTIQKGLAFSELLLGKYYSKEYLKLNQIDPNTLINEFSQFEYTNLINSAKIFYENLITKGSYFILENSDSERIFSIIELEDFPSIVAQSQEISELVRKVYIYRKEKKKFNDKYKQLSNFAELEFKRCKKHANSLNNETLKLDLIKKYTESGELLFTYHNLKEKGLKEIKIVNFNNEEVLIELIPKFSILENAENYYKKSKNLKKRIKIDSDRKDEIKLSYDLANQRLIDLSKCTNNRELKVHFKIHEKFYKSKMEKEVRDIADRFKVFPISDEAILYVGKDSKNNDELTFGFGKPNDYWFHLRGGSGSHCILKYTGKGNPPKEILEKCASIAAYYSSQRNGGYVPVAYTQRKYIRKPKGANSGAVVISKEEVILVEPKIEI